MTRETLDGVGSLFYVKSAPERACNTLGDLQSNRLDTEELPMISDTTGEDRLQSEFVSLGDAANDVVEKLRDNARFRHLWTKVHGLGERVTGELLSELADDELLERAIMAKLEAYARLPPETVAALGAREWPTLHGIEGGAE